MTFGRPLRRAPGPTARRRAAKGRRLKTAEGANKARVRARDGSQTPLQGRCRFPLCGCHMLGLFVEVSHQRHKGMGGDPTGERSLPAGMICLCNWRHKEAPVSIDRGRLRWVPLTDQGANGPVAWEMRAIYTESLMAFLADYLPHIPPGELWFTLARESAVQVLEPLDAQSRTLLADLARMRL